VGEGDLWASERTFVPYSWSFIGHCPQRGPEIAVARYWRCDGRKEVEGVWEAGFEWSMMSALVGLVALVVAAWGVWKMSGVGHDLQEDIKLAVEGTLEAIKADGTETRDAMQAGGADALEAIITDGAETRKTIADVHKSIKKELE